MFEVPTSISNLLLTAIALKSCLPEDDCECRLEPFSSVPSKAFFQSISVQASRRLHRARLRSSERCHKIFTFPERRVPITHTLAASFHVQSFRDHSFARVDIDDSHPPTLVLSILTRPAPTCESPDLKLRSTQVGYSKASFAKVGCKQFPRTTLQSREIMIPRREPRSLRCKYVNLI